MTEQETKNFEALEASRQYLYSVIGRYVETNDLLLAAIRQHRDERGDDRCYISDGILYAALPEGDTRPERDTAVTLENCRKFIECRQQGREYVSPEREIERLREEILVLRGQIQTLEILSVKREEAWKQRLASLQQKGGGNVGP